MAPEQAAPHRVRMEAGRLGGGTQGIRGDGGRQYRVSRSFNAFFEGSQPMLVRPRWSADSSTGQPKLQSFL